MTLNPLGSSSEPRTRAISTGFIFSEESPNISIDPSELAGFAWQNVEEVFADGRKSEDMERVHATILAKMIRDGVPKVWERSSHAIFIEEWQIRQATTPIGGIKTFLSKRRAGIPQSLRGPKGPLVV